MRVQGCIVTALLLVLFFEAWAGAWEGATTREAAARGVIDASRQSPAASIGARRKGVATDTALGNGSAGENSLTADRLLELYRQRLLGTPVSSDVSTVAAELERLETAGLPRLRFGQTATWDYAELIDLGLSASLSWSASDPAARAQRALIAKRLALAEHNERTEREAQLRELRRSLRLLAHLSEVEALLERHRRQLLTFRPGWGLAVEPGSAADVQGSLDALSSRINAPAAHPEQLEYFELVQSLERTRRERSLLLLMVAHRVSLDPRQLTGGKIGRPPSPAIDGSPESCLDGDVFRSPEGIRAELLLEESRLTGRLEEARALPEVYLDLRGNARYANRGAGDPWQAGVRVAVRVALPASFGVSSEASVALTPDGVSQELSVGWPPSAGRDATDPEAAKRAHGRASAAVRLDALRDLKTLEDARGRVQLRGAELALARDRLRAGVQGVAELNALAQAELALLNAELEVDLALIEIASWCGGSVPGGSEARP